MGCGIMITAEKAKELLSRNGKVRPQESQDWKGIFPLPPAIEQFYLEVGPVNVKIKVPGNPYILPSLADLWKFQKGYRWNGVIAKPIYFEDWNDDWIVVGDAGGDPFLFDRSSQKVLHAYPGDTGWDTIPLFPDLNTMAACLGQIGVLVSRAKGASADDEGAISPAFRRSALEHLRELLGSESEAEEVLKELGWD